MHDLKDAIESLTDEKNQQAVDTLMLLAEFAGFSKKSQNQISKIRNQMTGKYVIVRCRDAGVHSGYLESYEGRGCVLTKSRRLWYWAPASGKWLSAVANNGLDYGKSKISEVTERIHLTENCEIIQCTEKAEKSITSAPEA